MAVLSLEERAHFAGSLSRDFKGADFLIGLSYAETESYLDYWRKAVDGAAGDTDRTEHLALYDKHRRACSVVFGAAASPIRDC
jgi:hypothetical protein